MCSERFDLAKLCVALNMAPKWNSSLREVGSSVIFLFQNMRSAAVWKTFSGYFKITIFPDEDPTIPNFH